MIQFNPELLKKNNGRFMHSGGETPFWNAAERKSILASQTKKEEKKE